MNKNILKLSAALLLATSSLVSYTAKAESDLVRESVGVTVGTRLGTLGAGAEVAFPINDYTAVRANISYLPLINKDLSYNLGIQSTGNLSVSNLNGMALVDWHPFANAFRFSFGAAYNRFNVSVKDAKVDLSKVELPDTTDLVKAASDTVKASFTDGDKFVEAAGKVAKILKDNIKPQFGPVNYSATLKTPYSFVAAFGADNSTDPDASFVYGFDVAFMLVDPTLDPATTNSSTFLNISTDNIEAGLKDVVTKFNESVNKDIVDSTKSLASAVEQVSVSALGGALKTFGQDVSIIGGKTIVPSIMGHVAFPIQ